jgi:hypothetical protein
MGDKKGNNERKRGKDKAHKTYEKYGKHTNRHNRIKESLLSKRVSECEEKMEENTKTANYGKLYNITGPEIANILANRLCLESLHK